MIVLIVKYFKLVMKMENWIVNKKCNLSVFNFLEYLRNNYI